MHTHTIIGLIECGKPGQGFVNTEAAFSQNMQPTKAFVLHESNKTALRKRYPQLQLFADTDSLLQDEAIGLVLISAPPPQHHNLIAAALKAKKQVQVV